MRSFAFLAAPLLAGVALAQDDSEHTTTLTIGFTNSAGEAITTVTTYTYQYSNPVTTLLTQTNSDGIITGLPSSGPDAVTSQPAVVTSQPAVVTSQPAVVTSIPAVATIPAGLPVGTTTIIQGNSSFAISVGPSTTVVLTSTTSTTSDDASNTGGSTPADGSNPSSSAASSGSSPTETPGAAAGLVPASFGLVSFGALVAALL